MWHIDMNRDRGFSLIELMVGMTIGLIGMLIVSQVISVSSGYRMSTMAAGEAQSIGNIGLYTIEREARQAGYGLVSQNILNCTLRGYDNVRSAAFSHTLVPVEIGDTGSPDGVSDTVFLAYGTGTARMSQVWLSAAYAGDDTDLEVKNRFGFRVNDFLLLAEASKNCALAQVSALSTSDTSKITHTGTPAYLRYNQIGGIGVAYSANVGEVYDLGPTFNVHTYSVNTSHQLLQEDLLTGQTLVLADNVLAFKAEYGHDSDGDGTVDTWNRIAPTDANGWRQVTNIRLGISVKASKRENGIVSSSPITLWPSGPTVTLSTEDQHYRYRTYYTLVPLRNLIWKTL